MTRSNKTKQKGVVLPLPFFFPHLLYKEIELAGFLALFLPYITQDSCPCVRNDPIHLTDEWKRE